MSARSDLSPRLSGVYRSPSDPIAVQARAVAGGAASASVDLDAISSKRELLDTLAADLALPKSFGRNWDALADCLQDLPVPAQGWLLHIKHAQGVQRALGSEWLTLLEILHDAAIYWKEHGRAFVVFIDDAIALPVWR